MYTLTAVILNSILYYTCIPYHHECILNNRSATAECRHHMTRPRVPEMVEMFENNDTHMISYSEANDGIYPLADSPQLLRPPSLPNILDPSPPLTPASPRYLASTLRRRHKSSLLPGHQEPISSMAIDVDETRVDKFLKIYKLVKETIFYPFLYTTRGIEVS